MQLDQIVPVDVTRFVLDLHRDFSVTPRARKPGPSQRIDGVTIGFVSVTAPRHDGGTGTAHPHYAGRAATTDPYNNLKPSACRSYPKYMIPSLSQTT